MIPSGDMMSALMYDVCSSIISIWDNLLSPLILDVRCLDLLLCNLSEAAVVIRGAQ